MAEVTIEKAVKLAQDHQEAGRTVEAEALYRQFEDAVGNNPSALLGLGLRAQQIGLRETSLRLLNRALTIRPDLAEAHNAIGVLLRSSGQLAASAEAFQRAKSLQPKNPEFLCNHAAALRRLGRVPEALKELRQAIMSAPSFSVAHFEMGRSLEAAGRLPEAIESFRRAVSLQPEFATAWRYLGVALTSQRSFDAAIDALQRAASLDRRNPRTQVGLGHALYEDKQFIAATAAFSRAIGAQSSTNDALSRLDDGPIDMLHDIAIACFQKMIEIEPDNASIYCNLAWNMQEAGRANDAIALHKEAMRLEPNNPIYHDNLLNSMRLSDAFSAGELLAEHVRWAEQFAYPLANLIPVHRNDRSPERILRIGYVSPDLRSHPVAIFHVTCYSNSATEDSMTARMRAAAREWRTTHDWTDERLAAQITADQIDILIDLAQHTAGNRMRLFARKPAPVQVTYLGYPGTTGLKTFDAQISDPYIDPPGCTEKFSTEPIFRLPETYWCFRPITDAPQITAPPAVAAGHITFGCLSKQEKSSPSAMRLWAAILNRVAGSQLLLTAPPGAHRDRILELFNSEGVDPRRIELIAKVPIGEYFALYNRIDIALDPFPYNGGTTTCQALWMGVPVITLAGVCGVQRSGVSLLSNTGLPELIAQTPEQYVQIASDLAGDLPRLSSLRQSMRNRLAASPLMDAPRFVRDLESLFRLLWRQWCDGRSA
jgi:predicted O-linked N-acetylglucosamine transferase (SPINDLY family)